MTLCYGSIHTPTGTTAYTNLVTFDWFVFTLAVFGMLVPYSILDKATLVVMATIGMIIYIFLYICAIRIILSSFKVTCIDYGTMITAIESIKTHRPLAFWSLWCIPTLLMTNMIFFGFYVERTCNTRDSGSEATHVTSIV